MRTRTGRTRSALPTIALAGLLVAGCAEDTPEVDPAAEEEVQAPETTPDEPEDIDEPAPMDDTFEEAANVLENPEEYVGEQVTAPGTVDEVITPYLFSIGAADAVWDPLLVLHDGSTEVTEGMDVAAIGEVMPSLEIEEAAAFVGQDVDEAVIGTYSGDVHVQASQVEQVDPAP